MGPSVLLAITYVKQHAGQGRVVRLIEDILVDPRVTADGNV